MDKPITIRIEETKKAIVNKINESDLPINIIGNILKDLYSDVQLEILNQLIKDVQIYESQLKEKINQ